MHSITETLPLSGFPNLRREEAENDYEIEKGFKEHWLSSAEIKKKNVLRKKAQHKFSEL